MNETKSNLRTWLYVILVLLIFWIAGYFIFSNQPKEYPPFISESASPSGTKAFYTYLEREGFPVDRWDKEPGLLSNQPSNQLLLMIEPAYMPSAVEMEEYIEYMNQGNTILLMSQFPADYFGLATDFASLATDDPATIMNNNDEVFQAFMPGPARLIVDDENEVILADENGPIAINRSFGNGNLIAVISPEWIVNENILIYHHIELIAEALNQNSDVPSLTLFNDYVHMPESSESYISLYPLWFQVFMVQLALLTILWLWIHGKRFGPVLKVREESVRFSDERLTALAAWYIKSNRYCDSLRIQADYVKHLLQEKWGIPYAKPWSDMEEVLEKKLNDKLTNKQIKEFLNGLVTVLHKQELSKQEYIYWSKRLESIRKEVEEG
ncbi:hypothetical protein BTS2_0064 [Bacillus sp. TS-2]|nr:hypothetical protein BTS2_0064 [Bacillus sp. TS-2]